MWIETTEEKVTHMNVIKIYRLKLYYTILMIILYYDSYYNVERLILTYFSVKAQAGKHYTQYWIRQSWKIKDGCEYRALVFGCFFVRNNPVALMVELSFSKLREEKTNTFKKLSLIAKHANVSCKESKGQFEGLE